MATNKTVLVIIGDKNITDLINLWDRFWLIFRKHGFEIELKRAKEETATKRAISSNPAFIFIERSVSRDPHFKDLSKNLQRSCPKSNVNIFRDLVDVENVLYKYVFHKQGMVI